jgi:hypothetical protein
MINIEQIEAVYDARPLDRVRVLEWEIEGSGEVWVYWKPTTQHELDVVNKEMQEGASGSRWNAQLVCLKLLNEDGKRIFTNAHLDRLSRKGFSVVINRLASLMLRVPIPEAAEKNEGQPEPV